MADRTRPPSAIHGKTLNGQGCPGCTSPQSDLRKRITALLGGRAAEDLLFEGDVSTGAAADLQRAKDIATEMVTLYGMSKAVDQRTYKPAPQGFLTGRVLDKPLASETTLREIDMSVRDVIAKGFEDARGILTQRRSVFDQGAELLLAKELVISDDFPALRQAKARPSQRRPRGRALSTDGAGVSSYPQAISSLH
jgi:cell division protease FtsH